MKQFSTSNERTINNLLQELPAIFIVFDILHYDGKDLKRLPLIERKQILTEVLQKSAHFQPIMYVEGVGTALFKALSSSTFREVLVAKIKTSKYVSKRSHDWLKIIDYKFAEVAILGYRKNKFGWLLGIEDKGKYQPMGVMELSTNKEVRKQFHQQINGHEKSSDKNFVYVELKQTCIVKYRNLTRNGYFRSPVFVSWNQN